VSASRLSARLTDAYREQVRLTIERTQAVARIAWQHDPRDLDASHEAWLAATLPAVVSGQREVARFSRGYLTAFLSSELGGRAESEAEFVGVGNDRGGRPLREALRSPLIVTKVEITRGVSVDRALRYGLKRAEFMVGQAVDHVARETLAKGIRDDDRIVGYVRAVRGTCGACLGAASGRFGAGVPFKVHPNCKCVQEPSVAGVRDRFPRPTGRQIFEAMTAAEQDAAVGPRVAGAVRAGAVSLAALVGRDELATEQNFISQAPTGV
jgi:hypothetical protein